VPLHDWSSFVTAVWTGSLSAQGAANWRSSFKPAVYVFDYCTKCLRINNIRHELI
jgi:hypothetical protein